MINKEAKILVVDDMGMIRKSIVKYLSTLGYENIVEAGNGLEAVDAFKQESPEIVFMDIVMPEMTGDEALGKMREINSETPIIMLSSVAEKETIKRCKELGASGYILKALTIETGADELNKYLSMF
ncbi:MAG: response regulator transcription factor [Gammaproteobacteria bacterium]|nr:response regulator transcription factor [Gammaproteobacteria bacterium]MCK5091325.1 response regulator transcription factor [Gammaproteobacteria bacterium]